MTGTASISTEPTIIEPTSTEPTNTEPTTIEPTSIEPTSIEPTSSALTTCLWFDNEAEEAAAFYTTIFKDSRIGRISRFTGAGPGCVGEAITVEFELNGQHFVALNGGPQIYFNEAISFQVFCADQGEVDYYWNSLSEDGREGRCGWLQDRYGLSWQVIPRQFVKMISDGEPQRAKRVAETMMKMKKLDIAALQKVYEGE